MTETIETKKRVALTAATLGTLLTAFTSSSINIALPSVGIDFLASPVLLSWITTAYLLITAMLLVPLGKVADIYGRKKIFSYGIFIFTLASLLCGLSASIGMLIASRLFQGIGSAMIFGTGVAILTSVFPVHERGKALGINIAATYIGLSIGPVMGGFLTQNFGWRSIFFANIPFGILAFLLITLKIKDEWADAKGETFDFTGSFLYSLSLLTLMYGLSVIPALYGFFIALIGVTGMYIFVKWELRVKNPIFNMDLFFKNRVFAFSSLAALINYCATFAIGFLLSLYLQYIKGFDPQIAGLVLISQPVIMAVFSPLAGRLSDTIEPRILASAGMGMLVAGLIPLIFLDAATPLSLIIINLMFLGLGFAFFSSPNTNAIMSSVEKKSYGIASATVATMRLTGMLFSMSIVMLVLSSKGLADVAITAETNHLFLASNQILFTIFSLLCLAGVFASLARGKRNG